VNVYILLFTNKRAVDLNYSDLFFVMVLIVMGTGGIMWVMNMEKRGIFLLSSNLMGMAWCA
jgi:heme/copper-type cytochrome/quinol oxidase subunit 4